MPHKNWIRRIIKNDGIMNSQRIWQTQKSDQERRAISQNKYFIGRTKWDYAWTKALNSNASYFHIDEIMRPNFYNTVRDKLKIRTHSIYCSSASNYPLKGLHWLLIAIAFLLPKYPDIELRIADAESCLNEPNTIISFIKDQEYAKYLRKMIKKLGLINHIIALPKLNAAAVEEELKKTHIFCLPSLCENSPNSLAEAMLMEVPSIATFVGGIPDLIIDGYDGILCSPSDPIRLAEKIDILFSSDEISQNIAHNARIVAIDRHNKNRIASEIIKVYKSIIKDNTK
jgi:glycosyltransferase involved in cell wall biosynthesis